MKIVIKKFDELTVHELYEILKLRCDVFIVEQHCPYPDIDGRDIPSHHMMLTERGELIAYLRVLPAGVSFEGAVSIGRVIVSPQRRMCGIARMLMTAGMKHARSALGANAIKISAQHHLEGFYASLGFKGISEVYLEDGIPHLDMICRF